MKLPLDIKFRTAAKSASDLFPTQDERKIVRGHLRHLHSAEAVGGGQLFEILQITCRHLKGDDFQCKLLEVFHLLKCNQVVEDGLCSKGG